MSSIHATRYGTHELRWRENGRPKTKTYKSEEKAEAAQREVDRRLEDGKPVMRRKDVPTLEAFAIQQLARMTKLDDVTLASYALLLEAHVFPYIGHLALVDIRPRVMDEWQTERLEAGAGPSSIQKTQVVLSRIFKRAVLPYEYLDASPVAALEKPGYEKKPHRWLTAEEVEALRMWFLEREDLGSATFITVQAYVGIRPQDTLARRRTDLSRRPLDEGGFAREMAVTTKNVDGEIKSGSKTGEHSNRRVFIPEPAGEDIDLWLAESGGVYLFSRAKDGQPWTETDYRNWRSRSKKKRKDGTSYRPKCFRAAGEAVGLGSNLKPYDLRHTFATLAANAGWTGDEIANQLGNSVQVVDRVYRHMLDATPRPERQRRSIDDYIREARGLASAKAVAHA
jgi:integrase